MPRTPDATISEVLAEFLTAQEHRLSAKTAASYRSVIQLLKHSLNSYAYQWLDADETALFERHCKATDEAHREFCDIFGPAHILPNIGEFLNYFMVRKVAAGKDLLRAAGTVTKKLARWLEERGDVESGVADDAVEKGAQAARDLPEAEDLARLLADIADMQERGRGENEIEGRFEIVRVVGDKLWLEGMDGTAVGPVALPPNIARRLKLRWTISGVAAKVNRRWRLVEVWNVYPV